MGGGQIPPTCICLHGTSGALILGITGLVVVCINSSDWSVSEIPTSKYLSTYSFFRSAFSNSSPKSETLVCPHPLGKKNFYSSSLGSVLESF